MTPRSIPAHKGANTLADSRVLVVDDHPFTIRLVKDVLYANGAASVHSARDGDEALSLLRGLQPTLIVTDWRMPGLDGLAFTRIVRQAAVKPDPRVPDAQVPIIMLSAHTSAASLETARRAGVNEVVVKPFTIVALLQRMASAVDRPRPFVVTDAYVGPDRRRLRTDGPRGRRSTDTDIDAPRDMSESLLLRLQAELDELESRPRRLAVRP
jgi:CheY-like chemotaxis protein